MKQETTDESLKRLSYIDGHLDGIRKMVQQDKYCVDILKQTYAGRRAIEKLESLMLEGHMQTCVLDGIKDGREDQIVGELMELYKVANK